MAASHVSESSSTSKNIQPNKGDTEPSNQKHVHLYRIGEDFYWQGDLCDLKVFMESCLKIEGKWSSPGGDTKQFTSNKFTLKWHGPAKKKLVVVKDTEGNNLKASLKNHASEKIDENIERICVEANTKEHVVSTNNAEINDKCLDCEHNETKMEQILTIVNELKTKQNDAEFKFNLRTAELDNKIKILIDDKSKMAAENEMLKANIEELLSENKAIKCILDIKQNEWTKIEEKKNKSLIISDTSSDSLINTSKNSFSVLNVEDNPDLTDDVYSNYGANSNTILSAEKQGSNISQQINDYRNNQKKKFINQNKNHQNPKSGSLKHTLRKFGKNTNLSEKKKVLVIGDSMVKHIDGKKIARAGQRETTCHSYSGATIDQIHNKIQLDWSDENQGYDAIILHVGTNDLVYKEIEKAAEEMEELVKDMKVHAQNVAVSSVIKRFDGKVKASKISNFNNILHELCIKHKITFVDNECIDNSMLNKSNLHLNQKGDRVLGSAFCQYLKSHIQRKNFFRQSLAQQRTEWTKYLNYVKSNLKQ